LTYLQYRWLLVLGWFAKHPSKTICISDSRLLLVHNKCNAVQYSTYIFMSNVETDADQGRASATSLL